MLAAAAAVDTNPYNQNGNTQEAERAARDAEGLQRGSRNETSVSGMYVYPLSRSPDVLL